MLRESCYTIVEGESTIAVLRSTSESGLVCLYGGTWSLPEQADQIVWGALSYEARMNGLSCWATWRGGGENNDKSLAGHKLLYAIFDGLAAPLICLKHIMIKTIMDTHTIELETRP